MHANGYAIPKWFVALVSATIVMMTPWAAWVSLTLAQLTVTVDFGQDIRRTLIERLEQQTNTLQLIQRRLDVLEERTNRALNEKP